MKFENRKGEVSVGGLFAVFVGFLFIGLLAVTLWLAPNYQVYSREKTGEAELAQARSSKAVAVEEARAKLDSARMLAEAEIERAKGVAEANRIIGDSLRGNEAYLRYLWINNLAEGKGDVIYVPTEAGLPILEAGRLNKAEAEKGGAK